MLCLWGYQYLRAFISLKASRLLAAAREVARKEIINRGILLLCRRQHSGWVKYDAKMMGDMQVPAEVRDREVVQLQFRMSYHKGVYMQRLAHLELM